jgi:hypothetical protein
MGLRALIAAILQRWHLRISTTIDPTSLARRRGSASTVVDHLLIETQPPHARDKLNFH